MRLFLVLFLFPVVLSCSNSNGSKEVAQLSESLKNGDIIFQSSQSRQCEAVKLATHSEYSHVGILFEEDGQWMVYEAVQPVKKTPLAERIARGENGHYVLKRLKDDTPLVPATVEKMLNVAKEDLGKNYDIYFNWSDDEIYCSELVWKVYDEGAGIHLGELRQLKDFDLSSPQVQTIMGERYGADVPYEESVIAPSDIFDCDRLMLVKSN